METPLDIEKLKDTSKLFRDFGDFRAALKSLDQGIELLRDQLNSLDPACESAAEMREVIIKNIADLLGMKGGVYRRAAMASNPAGRKRNLEKAEEMYAAGAKLERNDSYSLTNSIVIPLIRHPEQLEVFKEKILAARTIVQGQMETRRDQWWFWGDLALLNLLAEDLEPAWYAYAQYSKVGARIKDFDSTIFVLRDLQTTWRTGEMHDRLARAISFLETERARLQ